jgi:hypothetical protein
LGPKPATEPRTADIASVNVVLPKPTPDGADADAKWYIRALEGRLFVRVRDRLTIGESAGEMVINEEPVDCEHAVIEVEDDQPVLLALSYEVSVNGANVEDVCELESGDKIAVREFVFQLGRAPHESDFDAFPAPNEDFKELKGADGNSAG